MKLKRTPWQSRVIVAFASTLWMAWPVWAQNLTFNQTKSVKASWTDSSFVDNGFSEKTTYTCMMTATLNGPVYVGPEGIPGLLGASINVNTSINGHNYAHYIPIEYFGTGGTIGNNNTEPGRPWTSPVRVDDTNDSFGNTLVSDMASDSFGSSWTVSYGVQKGPLGISFQPPANPPPISLQAPPNQTNEIDMADQTDIAPVVGTHNGLFGNQGNVSLSNFEIAAGVSGTEDIGTCSMVIAMNYGYIYSDIAGVWGVNTIGKKTVSLQVQYVRGDHLYQPVVTASASPSPITPGQTTTITVQINNPSPDLTNINGTVDFTGIGLNGATPAPTQIQSISIAPGGTVTETFYLTPNTSGNFNPQIRFVTGWQAPVPTTVVSQPIYANAPFSLTAPAIPINVQAVPSGLAFTVDGTTYSTAKTFNWAPGSPHTLGARPTQSGGLDIQYFWSGWSDFGTASHTVAPTSSTTYTVNFATQYFLTMDAGEGGTVSPGSEWLDAGAVLPITATANSGYHFSGWTGNGIGSYSGTSSLTFILMDTPITETADFTALAPPGFTFESVAGNEFRTALSGLFSGEQVVLQASTDMQNWTAIQTNSVSGSTLTFTNVINPALNGQYFRAMVK